MALKCKSSTGGLEMWADTKHGHAVVLAVSGNHPSNRVTVQLYAITGRDAESYAQWVFSSLVHAMRDAQAYEGTPQQQAAAKKTKAKK